MILHVDNIINFFYVAYTASSPQLQRIDVIYSSYRIFKQIASNLVMSNVAIISGL
jgi:hypothetical protein